MRREKTQQHFVDLTPSERLPTCQDVLKRVDLETNALTGEPRREIRRKGALRLRGIEEQPELRQGDDSIDREILRPAIFPRDPEALSPKRLLDVNIRS